MMNNVLHKYLYNTCFIYLDDIVVFASSVEELLDRVEQVVQALAEEGLKLSGLKSEFILTKMEILGHVVEDGKLFPKIDKLQGLKDIKTPTTLEEVRHVFGLISFYRKFVANFAKITKNISNCLKQDGKIEWTKACQDELDVVLEKIGTICLLLPDFTKPFVLSTDFSYQGIGAVLS